MRKNLHSFYAFMLILAMTVAPLQSFSASIAFSVKQGAIDSHQMDSMSNVMDKKTQITDTKHTETHECCQQAGVMHNCQADTHCQSTNCSDGNCVSCSMAITGQILSTLLYSPVSIHLVDQTSLIPSSSKTLFRPPRV